MGGSVLSEIHPRHTGGNYMSKKMRMISAALAGALMINAMSPDAQNALKALEYSPIVDEKEMYT